MTEETTLAALRSNGGLDTDWDRFYMMVHWQMNHERERAIKRGLELDEQLKQMRAKVSNVELRGRAL